MHAAKRLTNSKAQGKGIFPGNRGVSFGDRKNEESKDMSNKLFVGGLSWNTTSEALEQAFSAYGDVIEAKVVTDRESGRSRGFGFVTFQDDEGATRAIEELDGSALDGRTIRVDRANDKPKGDRRPNRRW